MTNNEIKTRITELEQKKREININTFELNPEMAAITAEISQLRRECTHLDNDGTFAINKHSKCLYCGVTII